MQSTLTIEQGAAMLAPVKANKNWILSPSDFAFLWEDCKRCFWLKVVTGFRRPSPPLPKIFTRIDLAMKQALSGQRIENVIPGFAPGVLEYSDKWVTSAPLPIDGCGSVCVIRGRVDTAIHFDDGTFGIVDFKTCDRNEDHIPLYGRQLHAYVFALEQAAPGRLALAPICRLGLLVFQPRTFVKNGNLEGALAWIEVERNDAAFIQFLKEVADILDLPIPPEADPKCEWCRYRQTTLRVAA